MITTIVRVTLNWTAWPGGIFDQLLLQFDQAEQVAFGNILEYLSHVDPTTVQAQAIAEALWVILNAEYNVKIDSAQFKKLITEQTASVYRDLVRNDTSLPRVKFNLPDERAMVYLEKSDLVNLGKYVNGDALRARVVDWIKENYLQNGAPIGNSPKELQAFIKEFGDELGLSKAKLRSIIDTTVSRARVFGQVNGLRASGAKTFEIAGPDDRLTCEFCRDMLGRTFDVALEIQDQERFINAGPESANTARPFLKGNVGLSELAGMDDADVQSAGFAAPPYHPSCRHRLIVVSFYTNLDEVPYPMG